MAKKLGKPNESKKPTPQITEEYKILQEIKRTNEILEGIRLILDNTWRGRMP